MPVGITKCNALANTKTETPAKESSNTGKRIGAGLTGYFAGRLLMKTPQFSTPVFLKKMTKMGDELSRDEFTKLVDSAKTAARDSGLTDKGVSFIKACSENADEIKEAVATEYNAGKMAKVMPQKLKQLYIGNIAKSIKNGENACYLPSVKKIVTPQDGGLVLSVFHETGHAMNANMSKIGSLLQKSRSLSALAVPILLIALIKDKKQEGEEPKGKLDKAGDFVKNNAGKLAFLSFMPTVIEEGLASFKGNKMAKELLDPSLAKKVAKTNALGFATYVIGAAAAGLGVYCASKIRDAAMDSEK